MSLKSLQDLEEVATETPPPSVKIFLDDIRQKPDDSWLLARDAYDFIMLMQKNKDNVSIVSLDHDLGETHYGGYNEPEKNGMWVCRWMVKENQLPQEKIIIHSMNPIGAKNMYLFLLKHTTLIVERKIL